MYLRTEDQPRLPAVLSNMLQAENLAVFQLWDFLRSPLLRIVGLMLNNYEKKALCYTTHQHCEELLYPHTDLCMPHSLMNNSTRAGSFPVGLIQYSQSTQLQKITARSSDCSSLYSCPHGLITLKHLRTATEGHQSSGQEATQGNSCLNTARRNEERQVNAFQLLPSFLRGQTPQLRGLVSSPSNLHRIKILPSKGKFQFHQHLCYKEAPYNHPGFGREREPSLFITHTCTCNLTNTPFINTCVMLSTSTIPGLKFVFKHKLFLCWFSQSKKWRTITSWETYLSPGLIATQSNHGRKKVQNRKWTVCSMFGLWFT